jgi:hypothetical protein
MKCILKFEKYFHMSQCYSGERCGPWASCYNNDFLQHCFLQLLLETYPKTLQFETIKQEISDITRFSPCQPLWSHYIKMVYVAKILFNLMSCILHATLYSYSFGWRTTADLFYPGTELLPQTKWSVRGSK